ncbi:MAG: SDR family oxidoreductase [Solimonas sp.]
MILKNKVVLVTGVGPGMGSKLAIEAARAGACVAVTARSKGFVDEVAATIRGEGGKAIGLRLDVADQKSCDAAVAETITAFGRLDGLVNSAYHPGHWLPLEQDSIDFWKEAMDVSLFGAMRMIMAVVPQMKRQGGGAIVNICSTESRKPIPNHGSYTVPKAALQALTRQMAIDLIPHKIRVNAAVMGWMWGAPVEGYFRYLASETGRPMEELVAERGKQIPIGHIPPDEECAKSALFLLSDYCTQMIGVGLDVNGGEFLSM